MYKVVLLKFILVGCHDKLNIRLTSKIDSLGRSNIILPDILSIGRVGPRRDPLIRLETVNLTCSIFFDQLIYSSAI